MLLQAERRQSGHPHTREGRRSRQHWLDVHDGRAVDGFDRTDAQPVSVDLAYDDRMKAQRVRPVGRSRRKDAREWIARVGPWVHLKDVATRAMKPRDDDHVVANGEAVECFRRPREHLEPGVGRSLRSLLGRVAAHLERGPDHTDRPQPGSVSIALTTLRQTVLHHQRPLSRDTHPDP